MKDSSYLFKQHKICGVCGQTIGSKKTECPHCGANIE